MSDLLLHILHNTTQTVFSYKQIITRIESVFPKEANRSLLHQIIRPLFVI